MRFPIILLLACGLAAHVLPAQDAPPPAPREEHGPKNHQKFLESLPPDIRSRFESARQKAMQDSKVMELMAKAEAARNELRTAVREAMMKADPGLGDLIRQHFSGRVNGFKEGEKAGEGHPGLDQLGENDRQRLRAAREAAKSDPAVIAAEEKRKLASTPDEQKAGNEEFHKAMRAAMLKADPSLGQILERVMKNAKPGNLLRQKPQLPPGQQALTATPEQPQTPQPPRE